MREVEGRNFDRNIWKEIKHGYLQLFIIICYIANMPSYHTPTITFYLNAIHTFKIYSNSRRHDLITLSLIISTISNFYTTPLRGLENGNCTYKHDDMQLTHTCMHAGTYARAREHTNICISKAASHQLYSCLSDELI